MDVAADRRRLVVPTVVAGILVLIIAVAAFMMRDGDGGGEGKGKGGEQMAAAAAAEAKAESGGEKDSKKAPVPVSVEQAAVAEISSYISATANLVAEQQVDLVAEAEGRVTTLVVEEGDFVRKGAVLATLNRDDAQISLNKARVRAANAKAAFDRAHDLHERGLLSRSDFDVRELEKRVADEELAEAEYRISKATVRAPFAGRVTSRDIVLGKHVRPGEKLFTIVDVDPLIARIYLPERDVVGLQEKQKVRLTLRAAESVAFEGRIRQISPVVDVATGTVKLTIEAEKAPEQVRPGAFVAVHVTREKRASAVVVPRDAVIRELSEAHVFVVDGEVAHRRKITLGLEEGGRVEAVSGLKAGDRVVTAGQGALRDGAAVKVMDAPAVASAAPAPAR